jgi:uncharacterized membrane protein (DUF4010 family)
MILIDKMGYITAATTTSEITVFFVGGCIGIALICVWEYYKKVKHRKTNEGQVINK